MATRLTSPPPPPRRVLTLDQAYERAWRAHNAFLRGFSRGTDGVDGAIREHLEFVAQQLQRDLVDAGVGSTFAHQLARPPIG